MNEEPQLTRHHIATLCAVLTVGCCCLLGSVGGAAADPAPGGAQAEVTAPSLYTRAGELLGRVLRFRGAVTVDQAGRTVQVQRLAEGGAWQPTATTVVAGDGTFIARWRTNEVGHFSVRAIIAAGEAQVAAAPPTTQVMVYRRASATWYGPGFYGKRTACGQLMTRGLLGVAHRTLPCGTPVEVFLGGKSIVVPVVDRGPFSGRARYDLTSAAAQQLGMTVTTIVGVAPRRGERMPIPVAPPPAPAALATGGVAYSAT